jgi:hypothetical protein
MSTKKTKKVATKSKATRVAKNTKVPANYPTARTGVVKNENDIGHGCNCLDGSCSSNSLTVAKPDISSDIANVVSGSFAINNVGAAIKMISNGSDILYRGDTKRSDKMTKRLTEIVSILLDIEDEFNKEANRFINANKYKLINKTTPKIVIFRETKQTL